MDESERVLSATKCSSR